MLEKKQSYLPSSMFVARLVILVGILGISTGGVYIYDYFKNKTRKTSLPTRSIWANSRETVPGLIKKDSNGNNIPDWEESLWGLDPKGDGAANKTIIEDKKNNQKINSGGEITSSTPTDDTDRLAREFFSSFMSLKESGNLSPDTVSGLADSIGKQVNNTDLPDTYTSKNIRLVATTPENIAKYKDSMKKFAEGLSEQNIGDEIEIMADAIENEDSSTIFKLVSISDEYKDLAKKLLQIKAPKNIAGGHLDLANDYDKLGTAIRNMSEALTNPVMGTRGIIMYEHYTSAVIQTVDSIKEVLDKNDTI